MRQTGVPSPMCMLILIDLLLACINSAASQNACSSDNIVWITFPELDPPSTPNPSDPRYTKAVLTNGIEPYLVNISRGPQDVGYLYPYDDYFNNRFNPVTKNYEVTMKKGINRDGNNSGTEDDLNILQYQMRCYPTDFTNTVFLILKIQIVDVNDNTPQFVNAPYTVNVNELIPVGITVFRGISANDNDEGPNKQIIYSLSYTGPSQYDFNGTQFFNLTTDHDGFVSVYSPLDFERMYLITGDANLTYYIITVTARDWSAAVAATFPIISQASLYREAAGIQGNEHLKLKHRDHDTAFLLIILDNALDPAQRRSSTTTMIVNILDGDDQGPEFVYPSCTTSSQPYSESCIRQKYLTTIPAGSSSQISLVFRPDPPDPNNPNGTVDILMQDMDTSNSPVSCVILQSVPAGFENYFTAISSFAVGKQYRCIITKVAGQSLYLTNFTQLELVVQATELSSNLREDYATVVLTFVHHNSTSNIYLTW